jgi:hypothetical protein
MDTGMTGGTVGGHIGLQKDNNGERVLFSLWGADNCVASTVAGSLCEFFKEVGTGYHAAVPYDIASGGTFSSTSSRAIMSGAAPL